MWQQRRHACLAAALLLPNALSLVLLPTMASANSIDRQPSDVAKQAIKEGARRAKLQQASDAPVAMRPTANTDEISAEPVVVVVGTTVLDIESVDTLLSPVSSDADADASDVRPAAEDTAEDTEWPASVPAWMDDGLTCSAPPVLSPTAARRLWGLPSRIERTATPLTIPRATTSTNATDRTKPAANAPATPTPPNNIGTTATAPTPTKLSAVDTHAAPDEPNSTEAKAGTADAEVSQVNTRDPRRAMKMRIRRLRKEMLSPNSTTTPASTNTSPTAEQASQPVVVPKKTAAATRKTPSTFHVLQIVILVSVLVGTIAIGLGVKLKSDHESEARRRTSTIVESGLAQHASPSFSTSSTAFSARMRAGFVNRRCSVDCVLPM
jgi:hypothetical protein